MALVATAVMLRPLASPPVPASPAPSVPRPAPTVAVSAPPGPAVRATALVAEGQAAARHGALGTAADRLREAARLVPGDGDVWNELGVVLVRLGDLAGGIEAFRSALGAAPRHLDAHRNLAVALERQGQGAAAVPHYRAFLRGSRPDDPGRPDVQRRLTVLGVGSEP